MGTLTMSTNRDDNFSILILKLSCQFIIQSEINLNSPCSNFFESLVVSFCLKAINILFCIIRDKWWNTNTVEVKVKHTPLMVQFLINIVIDLTFIRNSFKRSLLLISCASPSWLSLCDDEATIASNAPLQGCIQTDTA